MGDFPEADITTMESSSSHPLSNLVRTALSMAVAGESKLDSDVLSIEGMSGKKYRMFINNLISSFDDARYLEIGAWSGSTFCSAVFANKVSALAIDNWSQSEDVKEIFLNNISKYKGESANVLLICDDFRKIDYSTIGKFNIFLFDGPNEEQDLFDGLKFALPALEDHFVLIVDDWNWKQVRNGTFRSIFDSRLDFEYFVEIRTTQDNSHPKVGGNQSDWHNGYFIACLTKTELDGHSKPGEYTKNKLLLKNNLSNRVIYHIFGSDVDIDVRVADFSADVFVAKWITLHESGSIFLVTKEVLFNENLKNKLIDIIDSLVPLVIKFHEIVKPTYNVVDFDFSDGDRGFKKGIGFCSNRAEVTLIPDRDYLSTSGYAHLRDDFNKNYVPWENRIGVAFWRGSSTGWPLSGDDVLSIQRVRLCLLAKYERTHNIMDVGISGIVQVSDNGRSILENIGVIKEYIPVIKWINYKYQIDIDGNTNSWAGLFQRLLTGSAVVKIESPHGYKQWYYDRLVPWVNYVPAQSDLSDIIDKICWLQNNDEQAEKIGAAGRELALSMDINSEIEKVIEKLRLMMS